MSLAEFTTIRLKADTHKDLMIIAGALQAKDGIVRSSDDIIRMLLREHKEKKS